jgi:hypothetical protein
LNLSHTTLLKKILASLEGVHHDQLWGDINLINGMPWPYLDVKAVWNRFRILNADISRPRVLMVRCILIIAQQLPAWLHARLLSDLLCARRTARHAL